MSISITGLSFDYQHGASGSLRFFSEADFVDSDGVFHPTQAVGGPDYIKSVSFTATGGVATVPTFTLPDTEQSATNQTATISAIIYNSQGRKVGELFSNKSVPSSLGSTISYTQLLLHNDNLLPLRDLHTYTKEQTNLLLSEGVNVGNPATTAALGRVKMSVAPSDAASPIAVETTDPRLPSQAENDALQGTSGAPSNSNRFVTDADARLLPATNLQAGLVGTGAQTFAGRKTFQGGLSVTGSTLSFSGTSTDFRSSASQILTTGEMVFPLGQSMYVDHYFRSPRNPAGGGQFGLLSEIVSDNNNSNGIMSDKWIVGVFGGAQSPANNSGTASLYGGNFAAQVSGGSVWPQWVRTLEVDFNNNVMDVTTPNPDNQVLAANTLIGIQVISGGIYMPHYAIQVGATGPANKWQVGLSIPIEGFNWRAISVGNPGISQGAGLLVGHAYSTLDNINFARSDAGAGAGSFIRFRNATLTTDLFKVDLLGEIYTAGSIYMPGALFLGSNNTAPYIFRGTSGPEGVQTAPVGSLFLRTNGGAGTTLWIKESGTGNTGWVAK